LVAGGYWMREYPGNYGSFEGGRCELLS